MGRRKLIQEPVELKVHFEREMVEELRNYSLRTGMPQSAALRNALRDYLKRNN